MRRYWEGNAEAWTALSRQGYDVARDLFNTPTFLKMLPPVDGQRGLDVGCGEGHNTRLLAARGARMVGVDITQAFLRHAQRAERDRGGAIRYALATAARLPFAAERFDFATAFMSLQDMPHQRKALTEAHRVLMPGGFLQFSITHPCFQTPKWEWLTDDDGNRTAMVVGDYFRYGDCRVDEWTYGAAPAEISAQYSRFQVPYFDWTLAGWLNMVIETGFQLEAFAEPVPDEEALRAHPPLYDARIIAYFLIVRGRKPAA